METRPKKLTNNFRSEFNMGQQHFDRWSEILSGLDIYSFRIGQFTKESYDSLQPYWSLLYTLYINVSLIMAEDMEDELQTSFDKARELIQHTPKPQGRLVNIEPHLLLLNIHKELMYSMQIKGLGIFATREVSDMQKIRNALRIGKYKQVKKDNGS